MTPIRIFIALAAASLLTGVMSLNAHATGDTGWTCPPGTDHTYKIEPLDGRMFTVPGAPEGWQVLGVSLKVGGPGGGTHIDFPSATSGQILDVSNSNPKYDISHAHICKRREQASTTTTTTTTQPEVTTTQPEVTTTVPDTTTTTEVPPPPSTSTTIPAPTTTAPASTSTSSPTSSTSTSSVPPSVQPSTSVVTATTPPVPPTRCNEGICRGATVTDPPVRATTTVVATLPQRLPATGSNTNELALATLIAALGGLLTLVTRRQT